MELVSVEQHTERLNQLDGVDTALVLGVLASLASEDHWTRAVETAKRVAETLPTLGLRDA